MTGMDLVEFVTARLNEWETSALGMRAAGELVAVDRGRSSEPYVARVLREVAAMRAIVERYERERVAQGPWTSSMIEGTLVFVVRHLAAIWSEHPDYRADWAA